MVDYSDLIARLQISASHLRNDCACGQCIQCMNAEKMREAATALEALSAREKVLREALVGLSLAAGKLNVALHGQAEYRGHRRAVLSAMERARAALTNQDGGEKL